MSAWIVPKEHIDVLIKAATILLPKEEQMENLDTLGKALYLECWKSVACRYSHYPDGERPGPSGFTKKEALSYTYADPGFYPTAGEILCTIGCYAYQSCEHPGWADSAAQKLCREIEAKLDGVLDKIEYEGPWGWHEEAVERRRNGAPPEPQR